jgi:hypothetical protein
VPLRSVSPLVEQEQEVVVVGREQRREGDDEDWDDEGVVDAAVLEVVGEEEELDREEPVQMQTVQTVRMRDIVAGLAMANSVGMALTSGPRIALSEANQEGEVLDGAAATDGLEAIARDGSECYFHQLHGLWQG